MIKTLTLDLPESLIDFIGLELAQATTDPGDVSVQHRELSPRAHLITHVDHQLLNDTCTACRDCGHAMFGREHSRNGDLTDV